MQKERGTRQKAKNIDWITILLVLALVAFGILTIANVMADPFTGEEQSLSDIRANLNMEYVQRQIMNFMVGVAAMLVMVAIDYHIFITFAKYIYALNVGLLVLLLLLGENSRGMQGWFYIGSFGLQPSELCKISLTLMLSKWCADVFIKDGALKSFKDILIALLYFAVPFALVLEQPDFGTAMVYIAIFVCIVFISKISWKYVVAALVAVAGAAPLIYTYLLRDEQRMRIQVFLDPTLDPQGAGMHVMQSKTAIGSGQLMGKGYFTQGTLAQLKYVPERHTDFIFSGIAEGFGFVGGAVVIVAFFVLMFRWLWVAIHAKDHAGSCIAIGLMGMILAHVFENIGMTIGLMPVTGIPLPFLSYGGSNLLTNMMAVGLILNVWLRRQQKR